MVLLCSHNSVQAKVSTLVTKIISVCARAGSFRDAGFYKSLGFTSVNCSRTDKEGINDIEPRQANLCLRAFPHDKF